MLIYKYCVIIIITIYINIIIITFVEQREKPIEESRKHLDEFSTNLSNRLFCESREAYLKWIRPWWIGGNVRVMINSAGGTWTGTRPRLWPNWKSKQPRSKFKTKLIYNV